MKLFKFFTSFVISMFATLALSEDIKFNTKNSMIIRGFISEKSMAVASVQLQLLPAKKIYVYINSPGGSVEAAQSFITVMDGIAKKKEIVCIAQNAASSAFMILEACPRRLVKETAALMSHELRYNYGGSARSVLNYAKVTMKMQEEITERIAARLGLSVADYNKKIDPEWWMTGKEAIIAKAADEIAGVMTCTDTLTKLVQQVEIEGERGVVGKAAYSACPIIDGALQTQMLPPAQSGIFQQP